MQQIPKKVGTVKFLPLHGGYPSVHGPRGGVHKKQLRDKNEISWVQTVCGEIKVKSQGIKAVKCTEDI